MMYDVKSLAKGDFVVIPIRLLNQSTELWGEDANEFRYDSHLLYLQTVFEELIPVVVGPSDGKAYRRRCKESQASMATCRHLSLVHMDV
jgi:hypothetical protein